MNRRIGAGRSRLTKAAIAAAWVVAASPAWPQWIATAAAQSPSDQVSCEQGVAVACVAAGRVLDTRDADERTLSR
ncbi:MAG TPA: hypothetical protein VEG33_20965, partial [Streptosporangiaceae bacterium]|nr:hypothetical protein [Streptosporangiaceae bacterium]